LVAQLEEVYANREEALRRGKAAAEVMSGLTWANSIGNLLKEIG